MARSQESASRDPSTVVADDDNASPQNACPPSQQGMRATYNTQRINNTGYYDGSYMQNSHNISNIDNRVDNRVDQSATYYAQNIENSTVIIQRQTVFQQRETSTGSQLGLEDIVRLEQHQRQILYSERVEPSLLYLRDAYLATHRNMEEFRYNLYMHTEGIERPDSDERFDLEQRVLAFLREDAHAIVCLIQGSAGSGKSTFIHHLARQLWSEYQKAQGCQAIIPLYISLASLHNRLKKSCSQDLIAAYFKEQNFNDEQIRIAQYTRRFVFILDGYDEIEKRACNFYADNQLDRWTAKVIVTSRPEYLGSGYQSQFHPQYQPLLLQEFWIAPFSTRTIQTYISTYVAVNPQGRSVEDYQQWITQPDLRTLISNPFLLRMVVSVAPRLGEGVLTRGALYEKFIDYWFQRAQERLRHIPLPILDSKGFNRICDNFIDHGKAYCQAFALALYSDKALEVTYSQFHTNPDPQLNEKWRPLLSNNDAEARLLRFSSPFICRDKTYRFLHKSLRDYLVAQAFWQDPSLATCTGNALITQFYIVGDPGVLDFIVDEARHNNALQQQLLEWIHQSQTDTGRSPAAANAITILVRTGMHFTQQDLRGIHIAGANLSHGWFDGTQLQKADMRRVQLHGTWLREADISEAKLNDIEFGEMPSLQHERFVYACCYSPNGQFLASGSNNTIWLWSIPRQQVLHTFEGHSDRVKSVDFSPDGQLLASGSNDKTVRLWSIPQQQLLHTFEGHSDWVESVDFSPDGQLLASGSNDKTVRLWSIPQQQLLHTFEGHSDWVESVDFSPDGQLLASGSADQTVRIWSIPQQQLLHTFEGHSDWVESVDFSPDGQLLASGSADQTVRIWSIPQQQLLHTFEGHSDWVESVDFSPDGQLLASGSADQTVRIWSIPQQQLLHTFEGHSDWVESVDFSPDGQLLASGSADQTVRIWSIPQQQLLHTFEGHSDWVESVDFSPDGQLLASGSADQTVRIWSIPQQQLLHTFEGHSDWVASVDFSPDGQLLASGSYDTTLRLWSIPQQQLLHTFKGHSGMVLSVNFSPDGQLLASGSYDTTLRLWSIPQQQHLYTFGGHSGMVKSVDFSPDGQLLASGSNDKTVRLWSIPQQQLLHTFEGYSDWVESVDFSPDGQLLASGSNDKTVRLWSIPQQQLLHTFEGHSGGVESVDFSPDGQLLASGSNDNTVRLWSIPQQQLLHTFEGHSGGVESVDFSPDGQLLASGSNDNTVRLWSIPQQQLLHTFEGHSGKVESVDFSPDGQLLASGGADYVVRIWSIPQQQLLHTFEGHSGGVESVDFSPDGQLLASGSNDKTVRLWSIPQQQLLHTFKGHSDWVESVDFSPDGQLLASGSNDKTVRLWSVSERKCLLVVNALPAAVMSFSWHRDTTGDLLATGSKDKAVRVWHVQREKGHKLAISCRWSSNHSLNVSNLKVWGAIGLSSMNQRLLKQRGAIGVPAPEQGECVQDQVSEGNGPGGAAVPTGASGRRGPYLKRPASPSGDQRAKRWAYGQPVG